jgi:DHA1 family multidrug resistance protein-like MFS transporter
LKINSIIKYLIAFDFAVLTASGLIAPIFAIFIANNIVGGSVAIVGFASSIYMVSFSAARLISAYNVDKRLNERQRVALSIFGTVLVSASYLLYVVAKLPWHVYFLQVLNGIGTAFRYSPFTSLFTRYIDKGQESFEWGINGVATSLGQALTAAIGGVLAERYGFNVIFIVAGIFVLMGSFIPIMVYKKLLQSSAGASSAHRQA